jgi:two-component system response regulator FixJ
MSVDPKVFVVDDDADIRSSLKQLFDAVHIPVELYQSAEQFLQADRKDAPGCVLLDVRMPGMGGMRLLAHLQTLRAHPPVVVLTGHGDVPMVVQALKAGALDFIEKPANPERLLDSVRNAFAVDRERRAQESERSHFQRDLATLSQREREVLEQMANGIPNKVIAAHLDISLRTLEKHREKIKQKMRARSIPDLIRAFLLHDLH